MLVAYAADGTIVATLDWLVVHDAEGRPWLVDFEEQERSGGKLRALWDVDGAAGSASWPEALGRRAHEFKVELDEQKRIRALVHRSGERRERPTR